MQADSKKGGGQCGMWDGPDNQHTNMAEEFSVYRDVGSVEQGLTRNTPWVVQRIREGTCRDLIEEIRAKGSKSERDELKKRLQSICWSGTFRRRQDRHIIEHSGLICLDFDHVKDLPALRQRLVEDPYTHVLFTSPSGDGLKVVVRIPASTITHKGSFEALMEHYQVDEFDPKTSNISRVCYESYDPDIYYNETSPRFESIVEDRQFDYINDPPTIRLTVATDIIGKLQKWADRKFPITEGQRNDNLFKLASAMNRFGVQIVDAKQHLRQYVQPGFELPEIERVIDSAYRNTSEWNTRAFEDQWLVDYIRQRNNAGIKPADISKEVAERITDPMVREATISKVIEEVDGSVFWSKNSKGVVTIHDHKFQQFLKDNGFYKLYPEGSTTYIYVRVQNNMVSETSAQLVKDYTLRYVKKLGDMTVYDKLAGTTRLFKDDYLSMMDNIDLDFVRDTKYKAHLYFRNAAIQITKDRITMIDYADLGGYIWAKHVNERDIDIEVEEGDGEFERFLSHVAGPDEKAPDAHEERLLAHRTAIGYLLHGYKDISKPYAIIYNDSTMGDNPNGRTGKGIIMQAIGRVKSMATIDGKTLSFDKGFIYQTVGTDTQVLLFDDVARYFQFEKIFSLLSEGITIERKNQHAIKLPVDKSPKIAITTNYTIQGDGASHEGRRWELEMSDYYNLQRTPKDEFGHQLFNDWDDDEWKRFHAFMAGCLVLYLRHGLTKAQWKSLEKRKFASKTDFDFMEWADEGDKLPVGVRIYKGEKLKEFQMEYPDYGERGKRALTAKRFVRWLEAYARYKNWEVEHGQDQEGRYCMFREIPKPNAT